jgi:hypothetical protein
VRAWLRCGVAAAVLAWTGVGWAASVTPESCAKLRLHGKDADATDCFEALASSGDAYRMAEGYWGLGDYEKAKSEFEVAVGMPKSPALWHVRYGMLFHERFNNEEAA